MSRMGLTGMQGWIIGTFQTAYNTFKTAFDAWKDPSARTPVKTSALLEAEDAFITVYRQLYTGVLRENPLVTNADLLAMGMPERSSGERHPIPAPKVAPKLSARTPNPGVVEIDFGSKPQEAHGLEICWAVLDQPPTNWSELVHSSFDTASPLNLTFEGDQRGRRIYFAGRWESPRGEKGPWNEIQDAVIP
ncbi:MAG: hypothetical protein LBC19_11980 [Tannerella sp.]|nr:hypothetical protein [Tannerella sp.]